MRISDWSADVCSSDLLAPKRGRKAGKGAEAGNGIVGQEKISGTDSARDDKPFGFGGPDQVKALPRRHVAEVDGCLCLACQHDVAGNRNRFGASGRAWKVALIEKENPQWIDLYDTIAR